MAKRCVQWPACDEHRELADPLGHDYQGHAALNALVQAGISTVTEVSAAYLPDVRNLGPTRIALIEKRLTPATTKGKR